MRYTVRRGAEVEGLLRRVMRRSNVSYESAIRILKDKGVIRQVAKNP